MTRATRRTEKAGMAKAKPSRTDRRMVRNRKALLDAAGKLIAEKGFERLTIDEITESADLAKGTFYNHFGDKNEIAKELALSIRQELSAEVTVAQAGIDDPAARLAAGICVFLRSAVTAPTRAAVVAQMYAQWLRPQAAGNAQLRKDLQDGYRMGRFSSAALPAATVMTVGVVQAGISSALSIADSSAVGRLAFELSALVLRALGIKWSEARAISTRAVARVLGQSSVRA